LKVALGYRRGGDHESSGHSSGGCGDPDRGAAVGFEARVDCDTSDRAAERSGAAEGTTESGAKARKFAGADRGFSCSREYTENGDRPHRFTWTSLLFIETT